jgi:hypothetical protein
VAISTLIAVAVVQCPDLARLFHTMPLTWREWLLAAALSLTLVPVVEATKWWRR